MGALWRDLIGAFTAFINFLYSITGSYGMSIILFTLIVRLLLTPLMVKQQKSMTDMQKIQPEIKKLQEKYKNDKEKLSAETMKLYKDNNVSMFGGCLPLIIQMPILIGLYQVILNPESIAGASKMFLKIFDLSLIPSISGFSNFGEYVKTPYFPLLLVPVVAVITTFFQSKFMTNMQSAVKKKDEEPAKKNAKNPAEPDMANSMNSMTKYMMPLFTGYIAFIVPAGVGLYWIAGGVFQIVQQLLIGEYLKKKDKNKQLTMNDER